MSKIKLIKHYDGPATMELKLQHEDGFITTITYLLPDHLLAESVFEQVRERAKFLTDSANLLHRTEAYKYIRPNPLSEREGVHGSRVTKHGPRN